MPLITTITPQPSIELAHHRTHEGNHYAIHHTDTIVVGAFKDFLMVTPPLSDAAIHLIFESYVERRSAMEMYEAVQVTNNGTLLTSINYNRVTTTLPLTDIFENPILAAGEPILAKRIFENQRGTNTESGNIGEINRDEHEFIMKGSTNYLFRIIPNALLPVVSIFASTEFNWYDARPSKIS